MKAKVLAGAFGAILLTASVVVGFFQHAAFIGQNRGRRHSLSQVVASAGSSGADDLSSLLQTAKSELGISSNYASKVASPASSASDNVDSVVSAAASSASSAADSVFNAVKSTAAPLANSAADSVVSAASSAAEAALKVDPVQEGKAPLLGDFVKASIKGTAPRAGATSDWSATKSNLNLLKDNTIRLTGRDPADLPAIKLPDIDVSKLNDAMPKVSLKELSNDLSKISADDVKKFSFGAVDGIKKFSPDDLPKVSGFDFDFSSIQQFIENLPEATKTWAALAAGATFLIVGIANNNKSKKIAAASSVDIDATTAKIGGLTDELVRSNDR